MENITYGRLLSKDEQKLLLIHYYKLQQLRRDYSMPICARIGYNVDDLVRAFQALDIKWYVPRYLEPECCQKNEQNIHQKVFLNGLKDDMLLRLRKDICNLLFDLQDAKLVDIGIGGTGSIPSTTSLCRSNLLDVIFTRQGYRLAEQYSSIWHRSRLAYVAYLRHHPIILFIAFLLGFLSNVIGRLIVEWLRK